MYSRRNKLLYKKTMSVKFKINKLGPITDSEFEFKPFMLFTGNSSMGKSYTAFLTYYLINLITNNNTTLDSFVKDKLNIPNFSERINNNEKVIINVSIKDLTRKLNYDSSQFIGYLIGHNSFKCDIEIELPIDDFKFEIKKEKIADEGIETASDGVSLSRLAIFLNDVRYTTSYAQIDKYESLFSTIIKIHLRNTILKKRKTLQSVFLPPSKSALIGANYSTMDKIITSAGMYQEFLNDLEHIMAPVPESFHPDKAVIASFEKILGGKVLNEKGSLFYEFNEEKIPITAAASSIKELTPLFLLLNKTKPEDFSVLFEEPEAHTHPHMQIKVADLLCKLVNEGAFFQVTTHSDYFLNQINNSINLFSLKTKLKDKFKDFCQKNQLDENKILDPKKLGAYYFKRREDGTVEIKTQNVTDGIPFDTFEKSVDTIMRDSAIIENQLEELLD